MQNPPLHVESGPDIIIPQCVFIRARRSHGVHLGPIDRPARDIHARLKLPGEVAEVFKLPLDHGPPTAPILRTHLLPAPLGDHHGRRVPPLDHPLHATLPLLDPDLPIAEPLREPPGNVLQMIDVFIQSDPNLRPGHEPAEMIPETSGGLIPRILNRDRLHRFIHQKSYKPTIPGMIPAHESARMRAVSTSIVGPPSVGIDGVVKGSDRIPRLPMGREPLIHDPRDMLPVFLAGCRRLRREHGHDPGQSLIGAIEFLEEDHDHDNDGDHGPPVGELINE